MKSATWTLYRASGRSADACRRCLLVDDVCLSTAYLLLDVPLLGLYGFDLLKDLTTVHRMLSVATTNPIRIALSTASSLSGYVQSRMLLRRSRLCFELPSPEAISTPECRLSQHT